MDKIEIWKKASSLRRSFGEDAASPVSLSAFVYSIKGLSIVYYPMGEHLSGMCVKDKDSSVIAVNSSMTLGRQRFSLAHELYHLFYDKAQLTAICVKKIGEGSEKEREADQFASYFLMPPDALSEMVLQMKKRRGGTLSVPEIVRIEQHFQVSRQALLYRLVGEGELSLQEAEPMRRGIIKSAVSMGYQDTLYRPAPAEKQYGTYGHYIQQADLALEQGLISNGKYEELLLSAYRHDLVYGDDSEGGELFD